MLVMGIDTSLSCTGYSILDLNNGKPKVIDYGKIYTSDEWKYFDRIQYIVNELIDVFWARKTEIDAIVMEQPNSSRNMDVTRKLIGVYQIVGFLLYNLSKKMPIAINTKTAKKVLTGNGNAEKEEIIKVVNKKFKLKLSTNKKDKEDDIADSISVANCYLMSLAGTKNDSSRAEKK